MRRSLATVDIFGVQQVNQIVRLFHLQHVHRRVVHHCRLSRENVVDRPEAVGVLAHVIAVVTLIAAFGFALPGRELDRHKIGVGLLDPRPAQFTGCGFFQRLVFTRTPHQSY